MIIMITACLELLSQTEIYYSSLLLDVIVQSFMADYLWYFFSTVIFDFFFLLHGLAFTANLGMDTRSKYKLHLTPKHEVKRNL